MDQICLHLFGDILPGYQLQKNGDVRIDLFLTRNTIICDLPSAIKAYTDKYPR